MAFNFFEVGFSGCAGSVVERAAAEFRQRALAEPRVSLEKACAEARERAERSAGDKFPLISILQWDKIQYTL